MNLFDMKPFLDNLVETIAIVLDLQCTIINANPIGRVSGTGIYKNTIDKEIWHNSYAVQVIEYKRPIIEIDTTDHSWLYVKEDAQYYSVILHPITVDNVVRGVICLASLNKDQQAILINKSAELLDYLEKIAQLISAKFQQSTLLERYEVLSNQLSVVFESVNDGIILYSIDNKAVLQENRRSKQILNQGNPIIYRRLLKCVTNIADLAISQKCSIEKHINLSIQKENYSIFVQALYNSQRHPKNIIIILNELKELQELYTQNNFVMNTHDLSHIIGESECICTIKKKIEIIANNDSNILLLGESGTGKELFARAIHNLSYRRGNPFVAINCAAIPDVLLESELFGYEEGSFTGAKKGGKIGKFILADQGTLFLDEIGDMPLYLQTKLLRVLDNKAVDRLGGDKPIRVDIHIIAATNKKLEEMVKKKEFREDLYYRLKVIPLVIPPLRKRPDDISLLTTHFIDKYNKKFNKNILGVSPVVDRILRDYNWPGNIRELENYIEYMVSFEDESYIQLKTLPDALKNTSPSLSLQVVSNKLIADASTASLRERINLVEREIINSLVLEYPQPISLSDIKRVCKRLNISLATYYRKVNQTKK